MSKTEQVKAIEDTQRVAEEAKSIRDKNDAAQTLQKVGQQQQQQLVAVQDFQRTFHKSLDETKENVRKSIDEARTQIPRFTTVVTHYQEQVLESTGKMVEDYIEAQKSVVDSLINSALRIMKMLIDYMITGFLRKSPQRHMSGQLTILLKTSQHQ